MRVVWPELAGLSFPDESVCCWDFDRAGSRLTITVTDGWLDAAGGMVGAAVELVIGPWPAFNGQRFPVGLGPQPVPDPSEPLRDLCECGFGPSSAWLAGFGAASGDWLRYEFAGPAAAACHQDAEPLSCPPDLKK